ncbi:Transmembrane domain-containing protein [Spironucleus salmonicida]|uniref:Transmembrane domain-containing protein n=1 Tax=Spironucleus salmonicida TaxID=348837 RepID=V6LP53_9EUKA|nr:Transmembrane domain-containing protein [Spironucleus salmonicida]|eukprot:EST45496.1 Transmembrane domain-containing protein [Spironucleus salmonicida]
MQCLASHYYILGALLKLDQNCAKYPEHQRTHRTECGYQILICIQRICGWSGTGECALVYSGHGGGIEAWYFNYRVVRLASQKCLARDPNPVVHHVLECLVKGGAGRTGHRRSVVLTRYHNSGGRRGRKQVGRWRVAFSKPIFQFVIIRFPLQLLMRQRNYIQGLLGVANLWALTVYIYEMFCVKVISPPRVGKDNDFSQQSFLFAFFHCGRFAEEVFVFLYLLTVQFGISQRCSSVADVVVHAGKHIIFIATPVWCTAFLVHQNCSRDALVHDLLFLAAFRPYTQDPLEILQVHSYLVTGIFFVSLCNCTSLLLRLDLKKIAVFSFAACTLMRLGCAALVVLLAKTSHHMLFPVFYVYLYAIAIYVATTFWKFDVNDLGIANMQTPSKPPRHHRCIQWLCSKNRVAGDMVVWALACGGGVVVKFVHRTEDDLLDHKLVGVLVLAFGRVAQMMVFYICMVPVFYDLTPLTNRLLGCHIFTSLGVHANENFIGAIIVLQTLLQATKGMQVGPYNNGTVLLAVGGVMSLTLVGGQLIAQLFLLIVKVIVSKIDRYWELQKTKHVAMQIRQKMVNK